MKSFEDYYWSQFDVLNKDTQLARQFGQDVWDYKQKEIDNLKRLMNEAVKPAVNQKQTEIDELQAMYEKQGLYAFELQKRIDELQETATGWKDECRSMTLRYERLQKRIDKLIPLLERYNYAGWIKILKGNQNEN